MNKHVYTLCNCIFQKVELYNKIIIIIIIMLFPTVKKLTQHRSKKTGYVVQGA